MTPFDAPDAVKLTEEVQQEYVVRYGGPDETAVDPAEFAPPRGLFLVGYLDGAPVACGGWRTHEEPPPGLLPGDAEFKRMYVVKSLRGNGLARAVLAELERTAAAAGHRRAVLETGQKQPEAIALYRSSGYEEIPKFGYYRDDELSLCLGKALG
ncbi:Acetyltransferase (GNAT) family protein [Amycolatopsis sacchari]|uniref:Acetyltransferase (GNAT) family protein n=1 Tax=Amycolatopsis sacchari TaxID=115433 RepID=A0A1I4CV95_9PSEU|nr:Acetyltransferase (GNAT) family protein [Amycolatopsis sacchari]